MSDLLHGFTITFIALMSVVAAVVVGGFVYQVVAR